MLCTFFECIRLILILKPAQAMWCSYISNIINFRSRLYDAEAVTEVVHELGPIREGVCSSGFISSPIAEEPRGSFYLNGRTSSEYTEFFGFVSDF
jgi:hypothetical protein